MVGKVRQNYHEESEATINKQINIELSAHYQYLAMVSCQNCKYSFRVLFLKFYHYRRPTSIAMT